MGPSGRVGANVLVNLAKASISPVRAALAGHKSLARDASSSGNFANNSTSEIPNAPAVALFGAPNAIIARTKRRSASPKFELPQFSAPSASLSARARAVIAFGFRPEPGLAPPRPTPVDFVISNPKFGSASDRRVFLGFAA